MGLNGISYYAINQWHVASLQPPHLAAMFVWEGAADWYRDMTHHGGILCTFWCELVRTYRPYHTHDEKQPLRPGEVVELDVEIWPTSIVVPPGYRIGLTVRCKDYE